MSAIFDPVILHWGIYLKYMQLRMEMIVVTFYVILKDFKLLKYGTMGDQ